MPDRTFEEHVGHKYKYISIEYLTTECHVNHSNTKKSCKNEGITTTYEIYRSKEPYYHNLAHINNFITILQSILKNNGLSFTLKLNVCQLKCKNL